MRFLSLLLVCSILVCTSCKKEDTEHTSETRAPEWQRSSDQPPPPPHDDILAIKAGIAEGQASSYDKIRQILFSLPPELSSRDSETLLGLLLEPRGEQWNELAWAAIVNDGLNVLRKGLYPAPGFAARLLECYEDESREEVIRNYALQHFGSMLCTFYMDPEGRGKIIFPKEEERKAVEEALKNAIRPGNGAYMGTACNIADRLLRACDESGSVPPLSIMDLTEGCRSIALSTEETEHARITAFGFLGRHRNPAALEGAREVMTDTSLPILIRAAAIHYVGLFHEEQDRPTLEKLSQSTDIRLAIPAREGLKDERPK